MCSDGAQTASAGEVFWGRYEMDGGREDEGINRQMDGGKLLWTDGRGRSETDGKEE